MAVQMAKIAKVILKKNKVTEFTLLNIECGINRQINEIKQSPETDPQIQIDIIDR